MKKNFIYFMGALGGLLIGYDLGAMSGVLHFVKDDLHLSSWGQGLVVSSMIIGAAISCLLGGYIADKLGRKQSIILFGILFAIGGIGSAIAISEATLLIARFVLGLSVGAASVVVPVFLAELAPKEKRGVLVALNQLMGTIGILLAYAVALFFYDSTIAWRITLGLAALPAVFLIVGTIFLPQSPRYLVLHGKIQEAKEILLALRDGNNKVVDNDIEEIKLVAKKPEGSYKDLLNPLIKPALIAGIGVAVATQFTGINSIIYYAPTILGVDNNGKNAIFFTVIVGAFNFASTIIGMLFVDKVKRKTLLLCGASGVLIGHFLLALVNFLGLTNGVLFLIPTIIVIVSFGATWGILVWVVVSEMFPLYVRGKAVGIALGLNYFTNFLVGLLFPVFADKFGQQWIFSFFTIMAILILLFVRKYVIETGGSSLEEIEEKLMSSK
jgi:SP family sugar:H+ symporter-like MFS transporter